MQIVATFAVDFTANPRELEASVFEMSEFAKVAGYKINRKVQSLLCSQGSKKKIVGKLFCWY